MTVTFRPSRCKKLAQQIPTIPAPITITSAFATLTWHALWCYDSHHNNSNSVEDQSNDKHPI